MHVRRFRCDNPICNRTTFAETWPDLLAAHAQRTIRLASTQQHIALALGGEAGHRLLSTLAQPTSADTLLRLVRRLPLPEHPTPTVLGVDDFAFRRGQTYGTILVDLERHAVIDVLPDRTPHTFAQWLKTHPGVQIISRDRASEYARGATDGAPHAAQVADRFHLLQNTWSAVEGWLRRHRKNLRSVTDEPAAVPSTPLTLDARQATTSPFQAEPFPGSPIARVHHAVRRRAERQAMYERVVALHAQGISNRAIAMITGMSQTVVVRWLNAGSFPQRKPRPSGTAPFEGYVRERLAAGRVTAAQMHRELQERGFTGTQGAVYRMMTWVKLGYESPTVQDQAQLSGIPSERARSHVTPRAGAWLYLQAPESLGVTQRARLAEVHERVDASCAVYELVQQFAGLLRARPEGAAARFDGWLTAASASGVVELTRLARSFRRDYDAVLLAMTSPWSNGQVEGQVNRLKLLKRQMFGRANFDLLRARVLLS